MDLIKRKEQILDVSADLFSKSSYDYVSIKDIAEACNCSASLIIKIFKDKESIYDQLFIEWKRMISEPLIFIDENNDPLENIKIIYNTISNRTFNNNFKYRKNLYEAISNRVSYKEVIKKEKLISEVFYNDYFYPLLVKCEQKGYKFNQDISVIASILALNADANISLSLFPVYQKMDFEEIKKVVLGL